MDRRQIAVHRAAIAYGMSYTSVLPGVDDFNDPMPVIRGHSPRAMVALYGSDDDWALSAMQVTRSGDHYLLRLFDDQEIHILSVKNLDDTAEVEYIESVVHGVGIVPVVRFRNVADLDEDHMGEIERLIPIQDQIDGTTFGLLVAQHYAAFRQRWIIGWTAESEEQRLKASASRLWTFEDSPDDVKIGEFEQTDLTGYLKSREDSLRHAATLSQTPAHELIGQMVNLSAEALVAAEASQRRKITERQMSFGESWEQVLSLAGILNGVDPDVESQVRWRDTESRALSATVDALGKMAQMLGIPVQELWERIPGVSQQDVERWKGVFEQGDPMRQLLVEMERQAAGTM
jgi:hypothetical protein